LYYEERANDAAMAFKEKDKVYFENSELRVNRNFGYIYTKLGNPELALPYFRMAMSGAVKYNNTRVLSEIFEGLANLFYAQGLLNSCLVYSRKSNELSKSAGYLSMLGESSQMIANVFKKQKKYDSAFFYKDLSTQIKDSNYNDEKRSQAENLGFNEELRQIELSAENEKINEHRRHNIQLVILAIGILTVVIIFLLLSRSFIVSHKLVEFLGIMVLLIAFEFINLIVHPFLTSFTNDTPVLMLLALVAIAALIVPVHHRLEIWINHKLVEKNKAIRLGNARKTIQELEDNKPL
jgi:hypothetical protein